MTRRLAILCLALAVVGCAEQKPTPYQHKRCAPGYGLTVNDAGEYWPVRLETGLPLTGYIGEARTKQAAIERGWDQYHYENAQPKDEPWDRPKANWRNVSCE